MSTCTVSNGGAGLPRTGRAQTVQSATSAIRRGKARPQRPGGEQQMKPPQVWLPVGSLKRSKTTLSRDLANSYIYIYIGGAPNITYYVYIYNVHTPYETI